MELDMINWDAFHDLLDLMIDQMNGDAVDFDADAVLTEIMELYRREEVTKGQYEELMDYYRDCQLTAAPQKLLIVVDMQNDFIDGALGTPEAVAIVPKVMEKINGFDGRVIFTRDTHQEDYLSTQEGKKLPVPHCIEGTAGWEIRQELDALRREAAIDKPGFGSVKLVEMLQAENAVKPIVKVELIGLCTDICVISNAMLLKAYLPETEICVDASCCAGVTPESHENALRAMEMCQITII